MSTWYRVGAVSVANGATAVTGSGTGWINQVKEGDRIRFSTQDRWYEVGATPTSNTALALATAYQGTTLSGASYEIDRSSPRWTLASDLATSVAAVLAQATHILTGSAAPTASDGIDGDVYIRSSPKMFYGPKAAGAWPAGVSMIGEVGALVDGAATLPGIAFASDPDTGWWRPAANTIALSTAGAERVRVDSSGHVGIGGTPSVALDIFGSLGNVQFATNGATLAFTRNGTNYFGATSGSSGGLTFSAGSIVTFAIGYPTTVEKLRATSAGVLVGGAGAPVAPLSVMGICAPQTDNTYTLGSASYRWSTVYAATGTINTSDERAKVKDRDVDGAAAAALVAAVAPMLFRWREGGQDVAEEIVEVDDVAPATETVTETVTEMRVEGGVARRVAVTRQVVREIVDSFPVVDEAGNPVLGSDGKQLVHHVPRMTAVKRREVRHVATPRAGVRLHAGASAQAIRAALLANGLDCAAWGLDDAADPDSRQHVRPDQLMWLLWAAVRHLSDRLAALEAAPPA